MPTTEMLQKLFHAEGVDFLVELDRVGRKIAQGIQESENPPGLLSLGFLLARILSEAELETLEKAELVVGEESCNQWLADIMVETGRYLSEKEGYISAAKEWKRDWEEKYESSH